MPTTFGTTFDQRKRTLDQLEEAFLAFLREERREPEHDGEEDELVDISGDRIVAHNEGALDEAPQLVRTRTTTVHDYADPNAAVATDPPVSQAQRGAMHAAAQGNSTLGIPQSVGKEFAEADPGGKLPGKVTDDDGDQFELSPDGSTITDRRTGRSCSIEDAMRILFSGNDAGASLKPETQVSIATPSTNVASANFEPPKTDIRSEDDTMAGGALGGTGGNSWNPGPRKFSDGAGGKMLARLLSHKAGEDRGMRTGMRGTVDCGWKVPTSDYGTSEGARKRGQGSSPQTEQARQALRSMTPEQWRTEGGKGAQQRLRDIWPGSKPAKDYGTAEGARKRGSGGGTPVATPPAGWQPRDLSKAGYGGAAAAKNYPEGFVQGVGPATSAAPKRPAPKAAPEAPRAVGSYGKGAATGASTRQTHPMGIYDRKPA